MRRALVRVGIGAGFVLALLPAHAAARKPEASCYGPGLFGNRTASGKELRVDTKGVAHRSLAFGTKLGVRVGRRTTTVEVIDRGPFVKGRHLDLTQAAVQALGFTDCDHWGHRPVLTWRIR